MALMPALITVMMKAAEAASKSLARDFGEVEALQVSRKGPSDFVTAADKKAEKTIQYTLSKARPDFGFLLEEGGEVEGKDTERRFIVDPLDGTNNFLHGIPHWCISIAAEECGEITHGLVMDVVRNEVFWASKGVGAFLRNRKIRVSSRKDLTLASVATHVPSKGRGDFDAYIKDLHNISSKVSATRTMGSAALDLAYVASGRFDAMWMHEISAWDIAAGGLLVREAGGIVSTVDGGKDVVYGGSILAGNATMYQDILGLLK